MEELIKLLESTLEKQIVDKAKNSILICVFTISDDSISRKIIECHERGVKIRIITDNDKQ